MGGSMGGESTTAAVTLLSREGGRKPATRRPTPLISTSTPHSPGHSTVSASSTTCSSPPRSSAATIVCRKSAASAGASLTPCRAHNVGTETAGRRAPSASPRASSTAAIRASTVSSSWWLPAEPNASRTSVVTVRQIGFDQILTGFSDGQAEPIRIRPGGRPSGRPFKLSASWP